MLMKEKGNMKERAEKSGKMEKSPAPLQKVVEKSGGNYIMYKF